MTETFDAGDVTLERVREFVWEIPREGEMRVPARVLASEALLEEISGDKTIEQIRNVTHLPGIQSPALCMPDGHQGYGFPVGGVAAVDAEDGCISPGGVGYDINCLSGDTEVLVEFGRRRKIRTLGADFESERAVVVGEDGPVPSDIRLHTETMDRTVYEVRTESGDAVETTADHPFETPSGMRPLEDVEPDDTVFVHPFEGLPDERPPEFVVLDADDFADEDPQLVAALEERDLLPLRSTDEALHRLLKLAGHHTGDGSFSGTQSWFYGRPEDLADIRADIEALGFTPSRVYERQRTHEIDGSAFERREYSVRSTSNAFQQLLRRLGAPAGPKVASDFGVPDYLDRLADWQIALYLSAFFGAEMSAPATVAPRNFQAPAVSQSREAAQREALETFMRDLMALLDRLNVEANRLEVVDTARDDRVRLRFGISTAERNLIRFFTRLGYRYNRRKQREGLLAAQYLKRKEAHVAERARIAREARTMADGGAAVSEVKDAFESVNDRFVERSVYDEREGRPRPSAEFPSFQEFQESTTVQGMAVSATVAEITERGEKPVFDIGVTHDAHNFVANGFVVSNCGVRLVKTELTYADLQGREEELVDALFEAIPSGLGAGGVVQDTRATVEDVLDRGMEWAREEGYAVEDDLEHCEDEGVRPEADPSVVSQKAKDRGRQQLGSLGSGNHFLEVQRVTDVYRDDVGAAYGLEPDQVVVLIHCGSRGLGHQVCTDYLRQIEQRHGDLLERLPDRELAAAPAGSALADEYYRAMCAAINFAWVNRQLITYQTRQVFGEVFDSHWSDLGMDLLYDVAHNIAKRETHEVDGRDRELFVHRKGATRAFPAGHPDVPAAYRDVGQPIIIPGSMGAGSYVLRGGDRSLDTSFGSTAHGAGRVMSRTQAKQKFWGGDVREELREQQHVYVKAQSGATIAEEAPGVYKDVDEVVRVSDALGIGDRVARTYPVCNIKG